MENLRIIEVKVNNSNTVTAAFTHSLVKKLTVDNVYIESNTPNVNDPKILAVKITDNELEVTCQPLTNLASYFIYFKSTTEYPFKSLNGDAIILNDNIANKYLIIGPIDPDNPVKNYLDNFLRDSIYDIDDDTTLISKFIKSLSNNLARNLYDIRQVKNENYISLDVIDEEKTRGKGPFDRLSQEGAYSVSRVALTPTESNINKSLYVNYFPFYPITLQSEIKNEVLIPNTTTSDGIFNLNYLTLNLSNHPITKLTEVKFLLNTSNPIYVYNIEKYGYQILDNRYDQEYGFQYKLLNENQIKLNEDIKLDPLFDIENIINVQVTYEYKNKGIVISQNSPQIYTSLSSVREVLPPIVNVFNLSYAPIVNLSGEIATSGSVTFNNSDNLSSIHPAFTTEIPFRLNGLPNLPGQYSIDYSTGTVYVYGQDVKNDGTGPTPPLATYNYRHVFKENQDYTYDVDFSEIVSLPLGNLRESSARIDFSYELVLVPGKDYIENVHKESIEERIENRLIALNVLRVKNSNINNVFSIRNETSGEIYSLNRWNNDKVYFDYISPPAINENLSERVAFDTINNEAIFVDSTITNSSSLIIFRIPLKNNRIVSSSEDCYGSFFNTSLSFSKTDIFKKEKWFNRNLDIQVNLDNLTDLGEYSVDYLNGVIYCVVASSQNKEIGFATYKSDQIKTNNIHITSVDDLYYQISPQNVKNKEFDFIGFTDNLVFIKSLDYSDEFYLKDPNYPYLLLNGSVGAFDDSGNFIEGVSDQIKNIRGLYEQSDLINSTNPINFSNYCQFENFNINVSSYEKSELASVKFDGTNYYVTINENIPYISPNIDFNFQVIRFSDSLDLWDNSGVIVPGEKLKLILPSTNAPALNQEVNIIYNFEIKNTSSIVVDYNKGDLYIDYTYLADEILVSYEYGDNVLDFRDSKINEGTTYYVTYKAGALRDALYKNFGNLVNIPELTNFNLDFDRERYRDAVKAALGSFIQGPTVTAIKNIAKIISHNEPVIEESYLKNWSLGSSLLEPEKIKTTGEFQLLPAKFNNGALIDSNQTISFPASSNIRLEEGTFETWVAPEWNGLDNNANLTFNILCDNSPISMLDIFIGASEYHPEGSNGTFAIGKNNSVKGIPNFNKDGVYIYYDTDISGSFDRWYVRVIDGNIVPNSSTYKFKISSDGEFYDSKCTTIPKPSNVNIFTGNKTLNLTITGGAFYLDTGVTFLSDLEYYILDVAGENDKSRMSIYKDVSGYINFRVKDLDNQVFNISADVSSWKVGELHHVAASWKLNSIEGRDEMHLFLDGTEVPNIIKYGQKLRPYLHEKFRTVDPEEIIGLTNKDIIASTDLSIIQGQNTVTSLINFSAKNISPNDIIFIDEPGFDPNGYVIQSISVDGQTLTLNTNMPFTLSNGRFSVNRTNFIVSSDIEVVPNIAVTVMTPILSGNDADISSGLNTVYSTAYDFEDEGVIPGYLIRIDNGSLEKSYYITGVSGNTLTLVDNFDITLTGQNFYIYNGEETEIPGKRAVRPSYSISKDANFNNILTVSNSVDANSLILIRTLGLNNRKIKHKYYVWSESYENIIMTKLPPPISLDEAKFTKVILPTTSVSTSNSYLVGSVYHSAMFPGERTSNSQLGRTLQVTLRGNNVDFNTPVQVLINGVKDVYTITETLTFNDYGTLDSVNEFYSVNYIQVIVEPINANKSFVTVDCKEKYPITKSEFSGLVPEIKYSYYIDGGDSLYTTDGNTVRDENNIFTNFYVGNYLIINSPISVAGYYRITGVTSDRKGLTIESTVPSFTLPLSNFTGGNYQIFIKNQNRNGFQNGFFVLEPTLLIGQEYYLAKGFYDIEYTSYNSIKINFTNKNAFIGSDYKGKNQVNSIIDQVKIYSTMLTDTRIGENIPSNERSITKDFNSLKPLVKDSNTIMLINFNEYPFVNSADFYQNKNDYKNHFLSSKMVNDNFGNSLVVTNNPIILENNGILNTRTEGTIEFWLNPMFDTTNDPHERYYFDAYGAVVEETVSETSTSLVLSSSASKILNVKMKNGNNNEDYFAGGSIDLSSTGSIQEVSTSTSNTVINVLKDILQVIKVEIIGDVTKKDYFADGKIGQDKKTIYLSIPLPLTNTNVIVTYKPIEVGAKINKQVISLNKELPSQNTKVVVTYIPKGLQGDRLSLFKDKLGYFHFSILASNQLFDIRAPISWSRNSWHRVKASYKINKGIGSDEMRLFLDGYEYSDVSFTNNKILSSWNNVTTPLDSNYVKPSIKFKDSINTLYIGSMYNSEKPIFSLLDNFRISNISRPVYAPYGEPIDVNYNKNTSIIYPVTKDLYTTYLLDFLNSRSLNTDFAILRNKRSGTFNFSVNVLDSFGIVSDNIKVKEALEKLIKILKPANSKVIIKYTK